ncbi:YopX family protein [Anaerotignum sp. MB30-C6]|uniref:YopX family protein n=1 Tax=Anaerotignum sp. MB30-C6 TaxID=3070814 RepID=UPI0027DB5226|nr:YopX family protein [Anaerotignum sp. MB30-C6]WMI80924.1 YopX family protein [Anaerotignum sp. MB30-C6]
MQEILFRGKTIGFEDSKWVYGDLITTDPYRIVDLANGNDSYVFEKTVGQWTGLIDKNGNKIFEGDIVKCWSEGVKALGEIRQRVDGLWILYPAFQNNVFWGLCPLGNGTTTVEVIGNIHDNPKLKGEDEE